MWEIDIIQSVHYSYNQSHSPTNAHDRIANHTQFLKKTATRFGTEAPSSGSLQYKRVQAPKYQSGKYNAKYWDIKIYK